MKPSRRPSHANAEGSHSIFRGRCNRCHVRSGVDYIGTPYDRTRDKQGLVKLSSVIACWLEGASISKIASIFQIWKGAVSEIFKRNRTAVVWQQLSKPKLAASSCIIDITWGPHRRVADAGAPSRPEIWSTNHFKLYRLTKGTGSRDISSHEACVYRPSTRRKHPTMAGLHEP